MAGINTRHFAIPPDYYFWRWSNDGNAIEWSDGQTLAFPQESIAILDSLAGQGGIPSLGSLLLIHSAASDQLAQFEGARERLLESHPKEFSSAEAKTLIAAISHSLGKISQLPRELRSGVRAKVELCHALFNRATWAHQGEKADLIVQDLQAEPVSLWMNQGATVSFYQRFLRDASALIKATAGLDAEGLEHLVRTGIEFPELTGVTFDEDITDESEDTRSLLEKLAGSGSDLSALAGVARQVIGLISLPLPATKNNELPIGGVADIVNRGTPDKLLTSELAWGDTILASRLAQNEALYYHRETPPQNTPSERIILLDHGLRYWGLLRLFALATHLGLKCHQAAGKIVGVTNLLATKDSCHPFDLETPIDVRSALAILPTHLDLGPALANLADQILENCSDQEVSDVFLISTASSLADSNTERELHRLTGEVRKKGGRLYVIEIDPNGHLVIYEHRARGKRKLQEGILDLNELLPSKPEVPAEQKPKARLKRQDLEELTGSKFYNFYPPPVLFPARPKYGDGIHPNNDQETLVGIGENGHVMMWSSSIQRATELSQSIPAREHWVGMDEDEVLHVATPGEKAGDSARVYEIQKDGTALEVSIEKTKHAFPRRAVFQGRVVIFIYSDLAEAISLETGKRVANRESSEPNLHTRTVRLVDGEIGVSAMPPTDYTSKYLSKHSDSSSYDFPAATLIPETVGLDPNGSLTLRTKSLKHVLNTDRMVWTSEECFDKGPHPHLYFTDTAARRFPNEHPLQKATHPLKVIFTFDHRGLLHISNGSSSWTVTLNDSKVSYWKSRDADDMRPATKADFLTFLKNLYRHSNS